MKKEDLYQYLQLGDTEDNNPLYRDEIRWLGTIENGSAHRQDNSYFQSYMNKLELVNRMAGISDAKAMEYLVVSALTMASRAAIRGGMREFDSLALCASYYSQLETCDSSAQMLALLNEAALAYSKFVEEAVGTCGGKWNYVERARAYVAQNRTKQIRVEDLAGQIGLSRTYLTRIFKAEEGVSLHQYIMEQKLFAAANIIRYSDASITSIAEYLGFHSQSHLGKVFKEAFGMTPLEYRKGNHKLQPVDGYPVSRSGMAYLSK